MKINKLISVLLAAIMALSVFTVAVSAAADPVDIENYVTTTYDAQQKKVDTMTLMYESVEYGYAMYFDKQSGEFALKNTKTGEYTFSNPYDVAVSATTTNEQKMDIMSQIIVTYKDTETGGTSSLNSFANAALYGNQIVFKTMANGVRVEYAIGTVESKRLIPMTIEKTRYEEKILNVLKARRSEMTDDEKFTLTSMDTFYKFIDQTDPLNEAMLSSWRSQYKCLDANNSMVIYVESDKSARTLRRIENLIRKYCPEYTYDELEYDHDLTMYEGDEKEPALFRMAVEYSIDEYGLTASVPAKSIRYNETNYSLESFVLLPYFGCASTKSTGDITKTGGYIFIPDGSGTLLSYYNDDGTVKTGSQASSVYGTDYSFDDISTGLNANAKKYSMPVFGLTDYYYRTITTARTGRSDKIDVVDYKRGWLAVISEGDSFSKITAYLGSVVGNPPGGSCEYNTVFSQFSTKQSDTVNLGSSLGSDSSLATTLDVKYLGNYTVKYMPLSDPATAESKNLSYYYPSYVGMANAYRDYLIKTGEMTKLKADEIESSLPLYIETFGYLRVQDTFLTFPVQVDRELTTFDDIIKMSDQLKEGGITNLRYILTYYTKSFWNPKWVSATGGNKGFARLMDYAETNGITIFPDYDIANAGYLDINAGFSLKKYGAETMSGRYTTKREYDPIFQMMERFGMKNVVSSTALMTIYERIFKKFVKFGTNAISLKSLGTDINSDFNQDNPITREDSKSYITDLFSKVKSDNQSVLVSGGNAYVLPYLTDIIEMSLDNSGYNISSASVPFMGMVLHGYVNYAGSAINMAGDVKYDVMKALENGAALYFILSYQNTDELKNNNLASYYSVNFSTWYDDIVKYYTMLNDAIGGLQNAQITGHEMLTALRQDESVSAGLYSTYNLLKNAMDKAKTEHVQAMNEVDRLIENQLDPSAAVVVETEKLAVYNAAKASFDAFSSTFNRYLVDKVVSVTYTAESGKQKTFVINYNGFDVVIETEPGKYTVVEANSFIDIADAEVKDESVSIEKATAFVPTASELSRFKEAYARLLEAVASENEALITRNKTSLELVLSSVAEAQDIFVSQDENGAKLFINTNKSDVIIKVGDTRYITLAGQSFTTVNE